MDLETTDEAEALRRRVDALEREAHERAARANAALAAAQDRAYWLDRWNLDLNALMRRRGASEFRAGLRAARAVYRAVNDSRRRLPLKLSEGRRSMGEERAHAEQRPPSRFARALSPDPLTGAPVTEHLYARLEPGDIATVEGALEPAEAALWETADAADRKRLTLAFAAHRGLGPALERTGLSAAMPTGDVHSMAHGPAAAGGSAYYADLVGDSLTQAGLDLRPGMAGLDFGCSSGRVVRVLAAAFPELEWHGCDPIPDAIEWAREHLPGISFERSPEYPPLPYDDGQFDFAFAISIWSHFAEGAALDWLREMRRVIRPGGRLLITTHGEQTIAHTWREGVRSLEQLNEIQESLSEQGFWYAAEFGEAGDHGVANPEWGTAFLSSEWLLAKLTPQWSVALFRPGRVEGNQDLYVLERR
ncbi:MAG: class I SAM-dependent methyltransferase [Thermoleophilaceae bacterium]